MVALSAGAGAVVTAYETPRLGSQRRRSPRHTDLAILVAPETEIERLARFDKVTTSAAHPSTSPTTTKKPTEILSGLLRCEQFLKRLLTHPYGRADRI